MTDNAQQQQQQQAESTELKAVTVSVSAEAGCLTQVIEKIAFDTEDPSAVYLGKGSQQCRKLIEENKIKPGHILCMVRSFAHVYFRDMRQPGKNTPDYFARKLLKKAIKKGGCEILDREGRRDLKARGDQKDRRIAYMHMAIYVGEHDKKHYVVENAGFYDPVTKMGRIVLRELDDSFDDFANDDSAFFVIKPQNRREKTQQNALATIGMEFKYHARWFNCEAFTSMCAGFYDSDKVKPEHQKRLFLINSNEDEATLQKEREEREELFDPCKETMIKMLTAKKNDIDGHKLKLANAMEFLEPKEETETKKKLNCK